MKRHRGVTLIEIVLAIAILAVAILPMMGLLDTEVFGSSRIKIYRAAIDLVKEEMEFIRDPELQEKDILPKKMEAKVGERRFLVVREIEPASDPLKVTIRVFEEKEKEPILKISFLKEDLAFP